MTAVILPLRTTVLAAVGSWVLLVGLWVAVMFVARSRAGDR